MIYYLHDDSLHQNGTQHINNKKHSFLVSAVHSQPFLKGQEEFSLYLFQSFYID